MLKSGYFGKNGHFDRKKAGNDLSVGALQTPARALRGPRGAPRTRGRAIPLLGK